MTLDTERFLTELRQSHKQGAFTDYVMQHWHEASSECEERGMHMDEINLRVAQSTDDDDEFKLVVHEIEDEMMRKSNE